MDDKKMDLKQLADNWSLLANDIKKNSKINFDLFISTFSETYEILSEIASETCIDKKFIPVITNAYIFAYTEVRPDIDANYKAILILTERMLSTVTANNTVAPAGEVSIYILEARKEIQINLNDINGSIEKLMEALKTDHWN